MGGGEFGDAIDDGDIESVYGLAGMRVDDFGSKEGIDAVFFVFLNIAEGFDGDVVKRKGKFQNDNFGSF